MLKTFIFDNEFKSRERIKVILEEFYEDIEIIGHSGNVHESVTLIQNNHPNLLLIDVEEGTEAGSDVLDKIDIHDTNVILTSSQDLQSLPTFNFAAAGHLSKPIHPDELKKLIDKIQEDVSQRFAQKKNSKRTPHAQMPMYVGTHKIALPTQDGLVFIPVSDILFCQAEGAYTIFCIHDGRKILVSKNLKEYEHMLERCHFFRIHNSFLVNLNHIIKYVKGDGGYVIMSNNVSIDVSRRRKEAFLFAISLR